MSYGKKINNQVLFFIAFLLVSFIPLYVYIFLSPDTKKANPQNNTSNTTQNANEDVKGVFDIATYPQIEDTPSPNVKAESQYDYYLKGIDSDTNPDQLTYTILEGPAWLYINGNHIYGFPGKSDLGTYQIDIRVSDGEHSTDKVFYVVVNE